MTIRSTIFAIILVQCVLETTVESNPNAENDKKAIALVDLMIQMHGGDKNLRKHFSTYIIRGFNYVQKPAINMIGYLDESGVWYQASCSNSSLYWSNQNNCGLYLKGKEYDCSKEGRTVSRQMRWRSFLTTIIGIKKAGNIIKYRGITKFERSEFHKIEIYNKSLNARQVIYMDKEKHTLSGYESEIDDKNKMLCVVKKHKTINGIIHVWNSTCHSNGKIVGKTLTKWIAPGLKPTGGLANSILSLFGHRKSIGDGLRRLCNIDERVLNKRTQNN